MIIFEYGTFWLDKGDIVPLLCPKCNWPKEFNDKLAEYVDETHNDIKCNKCGYSADADDWNINLQRKEPS